MRTNEIAHITALERQAHVAARRAGKVLRKCGDDRFLIVCPRLNRVTPRDGTGQTKCPATGETTDRSLCRDRPKASNLHGLCRDKKKLRISAGALPQPALGI